MKTIHIPNGERVRKMLFPDKTVPPSATNGRPDDE